MIARLDELLRVRVFQPVTDVIADRFDRSCYWLAGQCALVVTPVWLARVYSSVEMWELLVGGVVLAVGARYWYHRAANLELRFRARPDKPPIAPLPGDYFQRVFWGGFLIGDAVAAIWFPGHLADCAFDAIPFGYFFFLACVPRLPRPKRAPAGPMLATVPAHG